MAQAEHWIEILSRHRWDERGGGCFLIADDTTHVTVGPESTADLATPPGNGLICERLAGLYEITGQDRHRQRAEEIRVGPQSMNPATAAFANRLAENR